MTSSHLPRPLLLAVFALSGAAALTYEVVWTRALSVVLGSTTYALSSMLATFMAGLAIGGIVGGRIADRAGRTVVWLGLAELGIGALGLASHLLIASLPALYLPMYRALHLSAPFFFAIQIGLCCLVMLAPTVLMGMTFPLVMRLAIREIDGVGRVVGAVYGANTIGSVVGAMAAGFALVPALGLRGTTLVAAAANGVVAALVLLRGQPRAPRALLLALVYVPLAVAAMRTDRGWTLINFYSAHRHLEGPSYEGIAERQRATLRKLYEREGAEGYVAAYRDAEGWLVLQNGGKTEGTTAVDAANARLLAYLPIAAHGAPARMLVIGLGAGVTLAAARSAVPDVTLAEINPGVIDALRRHGPAGLLDGIRIDVDDARTAMLRSDERWDVISSEPSYPTEFAVANLFSVEFYRLAAARLKDDGVFCQWLPYHMLTDEDVTMMVKTFASAFPHASLWKVPESMDLLLLGGRAPFAHSPAALGQRVSALNGGTPLHFLPSRTPEQIREVAGDARVPLNTDDRPRLEFRVARNFRVANLALIERPAVAR
jgi:spermidine synthase